MEKEKVFWTMKNGDKIDIDKMSTEYLRNVLKMIVKKNRSVLKDCPRNIDEAIEFERQENLWK